MPEVSEKVQKAKRDHTRHTLKVPVVLCNTNNVDFWRKTRRVGVDYDRKKNILMEVRRDDGSVSCETWRKAYCNLLNGNKSTCTLGPLNR